MKEYFIDVLIKHYADFNGRARRKEFWIYLLCVCLLSVVVLWLGGMMGRVTGSDTVLRVIVYGYPLAVLVPSIAVCVRRLHDIGKSGWFYFMGLVPVVGQILLLVWYCTDSQPGENQYGPNPKGIN